MKRFILIFKMLLNVCYFLVVHLCVVEVFATKQLGVFKFNSLSQGCEFNVPIPTSTHYVPIFLDITNRLELSSKIKLNNGEKLLLACPGKWNHLEEFNLAETVAECVGGSQLKVRNQIILVQNLRCLNEVRPTIKPMSEIGEHCPFNSFWIGYDVTYHPYLKKIFVCYDNKIHSAVYTKHEVYGLNSKSSTSRPRFKSDYTNLSSTTLEGLYRTISQIQRGHLSPHADFSTVYGQIATYYYVNVFPQWSYLNTGVWKNLENAVRRRSLKGKLIVYTGTYGSTTTINQLLPIPDFVWKAVYNEKKTEGIVFINSNRPRNEISFPRNNYPCTDLRECTGWEINPRYTIACCKVQDVTLNINIPYVKRMLHG